MQTPVEFTISARYYARGTVDRAAPVPPTGSGGERTKRITLSTANTVIAAMHVSSNTFLCEPDVKAYWEDWSARANDVTHNHIAPLFSAARSIGLRIMYICTGWKARNNYPQYREIAARVPAPPAGTSKPVPEWKKKLSREALGTGYRVPGEGSDIAPVIAAQPEDWIVDRTAEASTLLRENGIWNILHVGFDASGCVLTTDGGVLPMRSLGYRCFIVEDCVESAETPITRERKELKRAFLQLMQLGGYCQIANGEDIIASIKQAAKGLTA